LSSFQLSSIIFAFKRLLKRIFRANASKSAPFVYLFILQPLTAVFIRLFLKLEYKVLKTLP